MPAEPRFYDGNICESHIPVKPVFTGIKSIAFAHTGQYFGPVRRLLPTEA